MPLLSFVKKNDLYILSPLLKIYIYTYVVSVPLTFRQFVLEKYTEITLSTRKVKRHRRCKWNVGFKMHTFVPYVLFSYTYNFECFSYK